MSEAAKDAVDLNRIQTWIGLTGGILLFITLAFTILSTRAAIKAANAASKQAQISKETAEHQLRAYVQVDYMESAIGSPEALPHGFRIYWKNAGQTPTRKQVGNMGIQDFGREGLPDDFDFPVNPLMAPHLAVLGANGHQFTSAPVAPEVIQKVWRKEARLFIWGYVEYNDIFDDTPRRRTEAAGEVRIAAGAKRPYHYDVSFVPLAKYNATDDDCMKKPLQYLEALAQAEEMRPKQ